MMFVPIYGPVCFDDRKGALLRPVARVLDPDWVKKHINHTNPASVRIGGEVFKPRSLWVDGMLLNRGLVFLAVEVHSCWGEWELPDLYDMSDLVEECSDGIAASG